MGIVPPPGPDGIQQCMAAVLADVGEDGVSAPDVDVDGVHQVDALRQVVSDARQEGINLKIVVVPKNPVIDTPLRDIATEVGQVDPSATVLVISPSFAGTYSSTIDRVTLEAGQDVAKSSGNPVQASKAFVDQLTTPIFPWTAWTLVLVAGVVAAASRIHRTVNGSLNAAVQKAAITAVGREADEFTPMLRAYRSRRDLLVELLSEVEGLRVRVPDGAFYAFVAYDLPRPSFTVAAELKAAGVAVRAGAEYGPSGEGHLRLSFAADADAITEAAARIAGWFKAARADN